MKKIFSKKAKENVMNTIQSFILINQNHQSSKFPLSFIILKKLEKHLWTNSDGILLANLFLLSTIEF
jgi:hypothetical protein